MNKRFFMIQIIVFILLTACLVGVTYSWSTRPVVKGGYQTIPMKLNYETYVNGNQCTAETFLGGVDENGNITYNKTSIDSLDSNYEAGDVIYFRTLVDNASDVDTNVTLLVDVNYDGDFIIGTTSPALKEITYNATNENKWIPVVSQFEIIQSNTNVVIDWYIKITTAGDFDITGFALANN